MARARIGIDVGGTFTDLVLLDEESGRTTFHKLPSTPKTPHVAPIKGIQYLLETAAASARDVVFVGLGTTTATNLLLERKGGPTGLITTEGFRDLLEIGRQRRPMVFDPFTPKPKPLIPREFRISVRERILYDGSVLIPLAEADVVQAAMKLREAGVTSVAICFLHSYANPDHERRAADLVRAVWPDAHVVTSEALVAEFREYERLTTTVLNAYLMPSMRDYFAEFSTAVRALGITAEPLIMSSSGGALRVPLAAKRPIDTLFSGPSGGVSGAAFVTGLAGVADTINFDMGGTSTEVCVVHEGTPTLSHRRDIEGFPIRISSIAVNTIGAGGSSIAWIDQGGLLHVGPESVGADPGPACYGRGGTRPTVTDANVVLGRLNPDYLLGGALRIDAKRAAAAINDFIAAPKGIGVEDAAVAILAVSNNNIAQAVRVVSTRQGLDPADYALVAYGGAGPLHAASVAAELGINEVLIPAVPGTLCAFGVLTKNVAIELSVSRLLRDSNERFTELVRDVFAELQSRARSELAESGADLATLSFTHAIDARYFGQNFELPIAVTLDGAALRDRIRAQLHDMHRQTYGYAPEMGEVELVTFRLRAMLATAQPRVAPTAPPQSGCQACEPYTHRPVFFDGMDRTVPCAVYDRSALVPGDRLPGPAVIEQMDTTTLVPPGFVAAVDPNGNLRLSAGRTFGMTKSFGHARIEVVAGALEATTAEMCASLIRSAYSPNIKERDDCSTALCDLRGRTLSITTNAPAHLGSAIKIVPAILDRFPVGVLAPGDVFFANDPYVVGVTHLNDCTAAAPVFIAGRPVAFSIAVAHHSDVGGRVPGSESGDSTSIFQEGIRLPPVRLVVGGSRRDDLWELFLLNSRTPHFSEGDLLAQLSALERGRVRLEELYEKYGLNATQDAIEEVLDATEQRFRSRVRETLRSGTFAAEDWLDDDGLSDIPIRLAASVTVDDAGVLFDFSECPPQLKSGKNVPLTHTLATVVYCLKAVVDPSLPNNEGAFRVIRIVAPEGSIVNPRPPAAVSSRNLTSIVLADVLFGALGQAAPARALAPSGAFQGTILAGWDARHSRYFVNYENFAGGQGALLGRDGDDAMHVSMTNTSNLPIEAMEMEFPLRVERYELISDSGGPGKYRGGLGVCRDIRILGDGIVLATRSARQRFAAKGLDGGAGGGLGSFIIDPGSLSEKRLPGTGSEIPLPMGVLLRITTSGGGGFGQPAARDSATVARDVRGGKVSKKAATKASPT